MSEEITRRIRNSLVHATGVKEEIKSLTKDSAIVYKTVTEVTDSYGTN
jgi:hypothetical protein